MRALRSALLILPCVILFAAAPGAAQEPQPKLTVPALKFCTEPRPEMCMEIYQPVCGFTKDGTSKTYGNSCHACANHDVVRYTPGECKKT
ncbi:MAG TPA: hypothetical protein VMD53_08685 [Rhizomicrobium sp.]|nr:hypothetical protein [Rhizomicrobium sp.]